MEVVQDRVGVLYAGAERVVKAQGEALEVVQDVVGVLYAGAERVVKA